MLNKANLKKTVLIILESAKVFGFGFNFCENPSQSLGSAEEDPSSPFRPRLPENWPFEALSERKWPVAQSFLNHWNFQISWKLFKFFDYLPGKITILLLGEIYTWFVRLGKYLFRPRSAFSDDRRGHLYISNKIIMARLVDSGSILGLFCSLLFIALGILNRSCLSKSAYRVAEICIGINHC